MFHLFHGYQRILGEQVYLDNGIFGIEVIYTGVQQEWTFFLYPQLDQTTNTVRYFAFDTQLQKNLFLRMLKIQGIGGKIAYPIALAPTAELKSAVESFDVTYFSRMPGIGPKLAKRVAMELKQDFSADDIHKLSTDNAMFMDIVQSLQSLGFTAAKIKKVLPHCPHPLTKPNLPQVIKRVIDQLS